MKSAFYHVQCAYNNSSSSFANMNESLALVSSILGVVMVVLEVEEEEIKAIVIQASVVILVKVIM